MNATRNRVVSLGDMIDLYGKHVVRAFAAITLAESVLRSSTGTSSPPQVTNALLAIGSPTVAPPPRLDHIETRLKDGAISAAKEICEIMGWTTLLPEITRIDRRSTYSQPVEVSKDLLRLKDRIRDELEFDYFIRVQRIDVDLYGSPDGFGQDVITKFDNLTEDIEAAGNCLALSQPTACVFHLMRVMERGLAELAKKLKVSPAIWQNKEWYHVCNSLNGAIGQLPAKTTPSRKKKEELSIAASHLQTVRIAWRNGVMHPKQTYTQEQAREVFTATRTFMRHLATVV